MEHFESNCPLPILQSAYQPKHSTETALLKVKSDILKKMDNGEVVLLVLLDLSAAFDTIDIETALKILSIERGINGTVKKWLSFYLQGRSQKVVINDTFSDEVKLKCRVPQGSCLGPLLFIVYASSLFSVIEKPPGICR